MRACTPQQCETQRSSAWYRVAGHGLLLCRLSGWDALWRHLFRMAATKWHARAHVHYKGPKDLPWRFPAGFAPGCIFLALLSARGPASVGARRRRRPATTGGACTPRTRGTPKFTQRKMSCASTAATKFHNFPLEQDAWPWPLLCAWAWPGSWQERCACYCREFPRGAALGATGPVRPQWGKICVAKM